MGFSKKSQLIDGGLEGEGKKWVIAGFSARNSLKPINTKPREKEIEEDEEDSCTTPTEREAKIPEKLKCPAAPRKPRALKCNNFNGVREFFTPPDLETVFQLLEKAN